MDDSFLNNLISDFKNGKIDESSFVMDIKKMFIHDVGVAKIDHLRQERSGIPEVIFCKNKTKKQIIEILNNLIKLGNQNYLFSRLKKKHVDILKERNDQRIIIDDISRSAILKVKEIEEKKGNILILTAGTSDLKIAHEAEFTLKYLGYTSKIISDVGVSGIHRLFAHIETLQKADVIIVMAGMEGALATVVSSLTKCLVIGVPINAGYGASFNGVTALLGMLTSCAPGLTVVNIDNGFGAACAASKIVSGKYSD